MAPYTKYYLIKTSYIIKSYNAGSVLKAPDLNKSYNAGFDKLLDLTLIHGL